MSRKGKLKLGKKGCTKSLNDLLQEYITVNDDEPLQNKVITRLEFFYLLITAVALKKLSLTEGFEYLNKISKGSGVGS